MCEKGIVCLSVRVCQLRINGTMTSGLFSHLLWLLQALLVASSNKLWEVPTASFSSSSNHTTSVQWETHCHRRHLQDRVKITADIPPRLVGNWVSTRCEVRPGPEFLTRSYTFHDSRHLRALQHYYSDSDCQDPSYSLLVRAKLRLRQASWVTPGGTEADHHLQKVGMVFHSPGAMQRFSGLVPSVCVGLGLGRMVPGRLYELYNARAGRACLGALGFSMRELGLVRVETQHHPHGGKIQELFLGDVHTDWAQRTHHRPTGYQVPLQNAMHHVHPCPVCALVFRSSEEHPPVLPLPIPSPVSLSGRWVSQRCEAHPAVLFLTREFTFTPEQHGWEGIYRHYSDPTCTRPSFTLRASGHYAHTGPSGKVSGGMEFVFKVTEVRVTALEEATVQLLNGSRPLGSCGKAGGWELGAEKDITPTDGCTALGIKLPHKEYELLKMELDHRWRPLLFVGERPTDGSSPDRPQKRPTSYQAPMVRCGREETVPKPSYRFSHQDRIVSGSGSGSGTQKIQQTTSGGESTVLMPVLVLVSALLGWYHCGV